MDYSRFGKRERVQIGIDSDQLLSNPAFSTAVENVFNNYARMEENVLTDDQHEVREITAKIKHYAMMRRALMDVVSELKRLSVAGRNAS